MKYLITNADDYGWGRDISRGIIKSHREGILSSASVIVNEIDDESLSLAKSTPSLGLGLHLNIATGKSIGGDWVGKYGKFKHPERPASEAHHSQTLWNNFYSRYAPEDIYQEFELQLERFNCIFGKYPDHIDTHYNTYSVRDVFSAYKRLAIKYALPARHPVGYTNGSDFTSSTSELRLCEDFAKKLKSSGVVMTTYYSLEYINLHKDHKSAILTEIEKIDDGESIEISFHPGFREEWRRAQVDILTDPELKNILDENNVKVINYSQLYEIT
ncbi:ChbG/HpnK family deacetylase [Candidatus Microgenomates bacterium]|nr:MAG: ChbG/HpnK family deacetylase [Candidatus Microgenomates bacterium]